MGMESSEIAVRIIALISFFMRTHPVGHLFGSDASYRCFTDVNRIRRADVSFIRSGRLSGERAPKGHCPIAPDLAIEVVSPGDLYYEVEDKVQEYLAAGVLLVWVVNPPTKTVHVYRPRSSHLGATSVVTASDTISGEDVLPGFSCPVSEIFS